MIEERGNGNYVKLPSKVERKLLDTINKYFKSPDINSKESKEHFIAEIKKSLQPLITTLVRSEVSRVLNETHNTSKETTAIKYIEYVPEANIGAIDLAKYQIPRMTSLDIYVNGLLIYPSAYTINEEAEYISHVTLKALINTGDKVLIKYDAGVV